ncbi:O-acyltransferase like protein-like [Leguminivora glycinivorella]|uniref:O-acyltransferase like protein-like n=1 Tax=Leguminivora glycinivorella TaxID=1035111 RepID=UPI00200EF521|nr:O-acyltransferase like protein-like [Leguminivora glycinivorella]
MTFTAVDASGRYNSGAYSGRRHWLGSKQQCLDLDKNRSGREEKEALAKFRDDEYLNAVLRKDFSQAGSDRPLTELEKLRTKEGREPPVRLAYSVVRLHLNITKLAMVKSLEVVQGLCLPRSCSPEDITAIINFSIMITDTLKSNRTTPRTVTVITSRRIQASYDLTHDYPAIALSALTLTLIILSIIATLVDFDLLKCRKKVVSKTFNVQKYNNDLQESSHKPELTINNIEHSNINLMTLKKYKQNAMPHTLDVVSLENTNSCKRCGKYKKQCVNPIKSEAYQPCPRVRYDNSIASLRVKRSVSQYLLLCFSLNYGWKRIFNTNMANKDLSIMHAFRIATTFWVVFIHVATMVSYLSDNGSEMNSQNNVFMILATGSLAFDTLFFVSGLFSSYHFFYLKSQYSVEELVSFGGVCGQILQLFCFITNRAVRLLPSYLYAIFLASVLSRATHDTAALELPGRDRDCDVTWWRNILYITNLYPQDQRCLQVSWYLTMETQLHAAGALLCALAVRRRAALTLASIVVLTATATDVASAFGDYNKPMADMFAAYYVMLERPWARVAPYFTGVFAGWLVRRMDGQLKVSKVTSAFLWLASLSALSVASAVPWAGPAWVSCFLHLLWPVVLLWPALVCATNYAGLSRQLLDSGPVAALSRLCYSVLLLHGPITRTVLLSVDGALCSQTLCIWSYFAGTTLITLLASLLLSLLVEMPCCSLLRRLSDCATS